jgi:hypothetical protein
VTTQLQLIIIIIIIIIIISSPSPPPAGKNRANHLKGRLDGPQYRSGHFGEWKNFSSLPEFEPRTVQPVV